MRTEEFQGWDDLGTPFFTLSNSAWALVPLEAWRRGLTVTLQPGARYTITDGETTRQFWQTRLTGSKYDPIAHLCDDKQATRELLLASGVPAPSGHQFRGDIDHSEVRAYATSLEFPVCLKPNNWAKARGVFPRIEDEAEFSRCLEELVGELGCTDLVVEQHIPGSTLRVFVAGERVIGATWAEPANVVGDGVTSLQALIAAKAAARERNPHLRNSPLIMDDEVREQLGGQGLTAESIPADGETIQLRAASNLALGGDSWDVTDAISTRVKDVSVAAVRAVPGLAHAGVDLLVDDLTSDVASVFVNELNPSAGLGGHVYPANGTPRDVVSSIVSQHFPMSVLPAGSENWFFSLNQAVRMFSSRVATEVTLSPMPDPAGTKWRTLRVLASGTSPTALRSQIVGRLSRLGVHGRLDQVKDSQFDAYLAGSASDVEEAEASIKRLATRHKAVVKTVTNRAFPSPVGFLP